MLKVVLSLEIEWETNEVTQEIKIDLKFGVIVGSWLQDKAVLRTDTSKIKKFEIGSYFGRTT